MSQERMSADAGGRTLVEIQADFDQGQPAYGQPDAAPQGYAAQQVPPQGYAQQQPQGYYADQQPQGYYTQRGVAPGYNMNGSADAQSPYRGPVAGQNVNYNANSYSYNPNLPVKSKLAGGLLHILLGGIGVGNFYLGKIGLGIVDVLFCWTGIPAIVNMVRGILILVGSREEFEDKYHCISSD